MPPLDSSSNEGHADDGAECRQIEIGYAVVGHRDPRAPLPLPRSDKHLDTNGGSALLRGLQGRRPGGGSVAL
jgi:hypothetical protein